MKVKGQNLRLFNDDQPFAAATTCTVSIQPSFANASTKDDDGYDVNIPVGNSWTAEVEQLIVEKSVLRTIVYTTEEIEATVGQEALSIFRSTTPITVAPGESIEVNEEAVYPYIIIRTLSGYSVVGLHDANSAGYYNNGDAPITVYVATGESGQTGYLILDPDGYTDAIRETIGSYNLALTMCVTSGKKNRTSDVELLSGVGMITNLQITAQNREAVVLRCTITGSGSLSLTQNPAVEIPDIAFFADEECTVPVNSIIAGGTVYAKLYRSFPADTDIMYSRSGSTVELGNEYQDYMILVNGQDADSDGQGTPFVEGQVVAVRNNTQNAISISQKYYAAEIQ